MHPEKLPKDKLPEILVKAREGFSIGELAKQYEIDPSVLLRKLNRYHKEEMDQLRELGLIAAGKRRTGRAQKMDDEELAKHHAVVDVVKHQMTYQQAAKKHGMATMTLFRWVKKVKDMTAKNLLLSDSNDNAI